MLPGERTYSRKHARADDFAVISPRISIGYGYPRTASLLKLYGSASFFKLLFHFLGFVLGSGFLNSSRRAFYHVFRFFQTETGNTANRLDNAYFLVTKTGQNHVELVLFGGGFATCVSRGSGWRC